MNDDPILTALMALSAVLMFAVIYILPVVGVIIGAILLKKQPEHRATGIVVLSVSIAACLAVAVWKVLEAVGA